MRLDASHKIEFLYHLVFFFIENDSGFCVRICRTILCVFGISQHTFTFFKRGGNGNSEFLSGNCS